jgi:hypothetical protein
MSGSRLAGIPIDHVVAELAAYPLASAAALRHRITALDPRLDEPTGSFWRHVEREALGHFPAFGVDEAVAIRDSLWFRRAGSPAVSLHQYLREIARDFLEPRGSWAVPTLPVGPFRGGGMVSDQKSAHGEASVLARRAWRWLSFAVPPDLLLAALGSSESMPTRVEVVSPVLQRYLADSGYAETHLHLGAALDFPAIWASAMHRLANPRVNEVAFESPGAELSEGRELGPWLVRAAVARFLLAAYLGSRKTGDRLRDFVRGREFERLIRPVKPLATAYVEPVVLGDLQRGRLSVGNHRHFGALRSLYAGMTRAAVTPSARALDDIPRLDPVNRFFPPGRDKSVSAEMLLVAGALDLFHRGEADPLFTVVFWQCVRVRGLLYRHLVQRPMTPGLQWFVRFYDRKRPMAPSLEAVLLASAARLGGLGQGLKSLEVRTAPRRTWSEQVGFLEELDRAANRLVSRPPPPRRPREAARFVRAGDPPGHDCEFGCVLHFIKDRGGKVGRGKPEAFWAESHADPSSNAYAFRHSAYYRKRADEARAVAGSLLRYPLVLQILRGLDVCTDELSTPTWVLAPLIRYIRQVGQAASAALARRLELDVPPLRLTAHAGEDFVHLLTGLRNVAQVHDAFGFGEGDRIGHGMALGVRAADWVARAGRIPVPVEDRLFDLSWEWSCYGRGLSVAPDGRLAWIDHEIHRLAAFIFGDRAGLGPHEIERLTDDLFDVERLAQTGFPGRPAAVSPAPAPRNRLLFHFLTNPAVFHRGREIVWVDPGDEGPALESLQSALRLRFAAQGITIEVNPSSNLLIGDLGDLTNHPLWQLLSPSNGPQTEEPEPQLALCIGSDDPLPFGTNLRDEYQLVHDAMVLAGLSHAEAAVWLEKTRRRGLESRFTVPRSRILPLRRFCNARPRIPPLRP